MSPRQLGRYEITGTLGRGSMGVVYQAHDSLIDRTVAIKTVSYAGLTPEEASEFEQRFFLEAKSAGRLNHPGIVTIHDVGHADDLAYIAMEFLSGESLRAVLDSGVVLPPKRIADIAAQVADGLAFAHAKGVVHRDIKPANLMVLDGGIVKISDFGIALLPCGSLTMHGTTVGSPKYMSPEQVLGKKADGRSDIFSLGVVLYEMLTGNPPFTGDDLNAILYQVLNTAPPLPSALNPGLPAGFDRIVARALSKDPDKRYQNAADMAADLRNYRRIAGLLQGAEKAGSTPTDSADDAGTSPVPPIAPALPSDASNGSIARAPRRGLIIAVSTMLVCVIGYLGWSQTHPDTKTISPENASIDASAVTATALAASTPPAVENATGLPAPEVTKPAETAKLSPLAADPVKASSPQKTAKKRNAPEARQAPRETAVAISPQTSERASATPEKRPRADDWKALLRAELAACELESFFSRVVCNEKARWKYCPGHWGSIDECPKPAENSSP